MSSTSVSAFWWIGHYLLHHEHDANCVCHRILRAGGALGLYPQGVDEKVGGFKRMEWRTLPDFQFGHGFSDFSSDRPLEKLARYQNRIAAMVSVRIRKVPRTVGGVNVSYISPRKKAWRPTPWWKR